MKLKIFSLAFSLMIILTGCYNKDIDSNPKTVAQFDPPKSGDVTITMSTTLGDMQFKLLKDVAPKAVENFTTLAEQGYYNDLSFHRVIEDFMIQGGDPTGTGTGGQSIWGQPFEDEFERDTLHYVGALAMANSGPNTNGSQFFIVQAKKVEEELLVQMEDFNYPKETIEAYKEKGGAPWLDGKHTVFGQLYEGFDVLDKIASLPVNTESKPLENILIKSIKIEELV
ncbi:MAG: peptidylprolyl isomerase [Oscillospiraceae bacterium]